MNTEQPEPLAAVLAEMRASSLSTVRAWADRIEAAAERERDEDRQLAAIAESDEAFARCARCDRPERVPGNASFCAPMTLEGAIEHAESRADETPCGQAHAQLAGWLRELRDRRTAPGNAAKMREALEWAAQFIELGVDDDLGADGQNLTTAAEMARDALSAPCRNCDRFATELDARLAWKREAHCKGDYRYWLFATAEGGDHA